MFSLASTTVGLTLNYRDAKRTFECIQSLLVDGIGHVFVWDNSEDDGLSAAELHALLLEDQRVSLHVSVKNLGFAAGVNRGSEWIASCVPDAWILLINNDALIVPGSLCVMQNQLQDNQDAIMVYPRIDVGERSSGTLFCHRLFGLITTRKLFGSIAYASGCCQLLDPHRLVGSWFDEDFFMYGEDVEFGYRVGSGRMKYAPEAIVKHEGSASSGMGSIFYETRIVSSHWLLASKLAKNRFDRLFLYVGRFLMLTSRALIRAARYRSSVPIKALYVGLQLP